MGKFIDRISKMLSWIGVTFFLTSIMLLVSMDVFCRYIFNAPIEGTFEVVSLLLVPVVFFTLSECWIEGGHVRVDFIMRRFNPTWQLLMDLIAAGVGLFYIGMLTWQAGLDTMESLKFNELTDQLQIPVWPVRMLMTLGLVLFIVQLLRSLLLYVRQLKNMKQ